MKASFIFALAAIFAIASAAPCGKNHHDSTTQVQTVNGKDGAEGANGSLIGLNLLNGNINALGQQSDTDSVAMHQAAN